MQASSNNEVRSDVSATALLRYAIPSDCRSASDPDALVTHHLVALQADPKFYLRYTDIYVGQPTVEEDAYVVDNGTSQFAPCPCCRFVAAPTSHSQSLTCTAMLCISSDAYAVPAP